MKKRTQTNLDAMGKLLPELDESEQRRIVGGNGDLAGHFFLERKEVLGQE